MAITALDLLLQRIPAFYNKTPGVSPVSTPIQIPSGTGNPPLTVGTASIVSGASDIVELMSSVGFNLDLLFQNIQTIKDISYIGDVSVVIPTTQLNQFLNSFSTLANPTALAFDTSGNAFSASGSSIQKFDTGGNNVATFGPFDAGHGYTSTTGLLTNPSDMVIDGSNRIWVTDSVLNIVNVYSSSGVFQFFTGGTGNTNGLFTTPLGIVFDSHLNFMVVVDSTKRLQTFNLSGAWQQTYTDAHIFTPTSMNTDSGGFIFVTDANGSINIFDNNISYVTTYQGPNFGGAGAANYRYIEIYNNNPNSNYMIAYDQTTQTIQNIFFTENTSPANFSQSPSGNYPGFGSGAGQYLGISSMKFDGAEGKIATLDPVKHIISFYSLNFIFNSGPLFTTVLEQTVNPGNIIDVPQSSFTTFMASLPTPSDPLNVIYVIVRNTGTFSFRLNNVIIAPGGYAVFNWRPENSLWVPLDITGYSSMTNSFTVSNPLNAVIVPGPTFPGFVSPDLDPLGANFGLPRIISEDDPTYKKRINLFATGSKMVPSGIIDQFRVIYGITAQVFQWFPKSYTQLKTYLAAHPGYTAFYLDGSPVTIGLPPLDLTASQGPTSVFYVVLSGNGVLSIPNGVYPDDFTATPPDWSFMDYEDTSIGPGHHGGFFVPNVGEPDFTINNQLERYIRLIQLIKAAGTEAILIISP